MLYADEMFAWFRAELTARGGVEVPEKVCWFSIQCVLNGALVSWVEPESYKAGCGRMEGDQVGELWEAVAGKIALPPAVQKMEIILTTAGLVEVSLQMLATPAAESGG